MHADQIHHDKQVARTWFEKVIYPARGCVKWKMMHKSHQGLDSIYSTGPNNKYRVKIFRYLAYTVGGKIKSIRLTAANGLDFPTSMES